MRITYDPKKRAKTLAERGLDFAETPTRARRLEYGLGALARRHAAIAAARRRRSAPVRRVTTPANRAADLAHGRSLYAGTCVACHGSDGTGGIHGAALKSTALGLEELMTTIANGRESMPAFGRVMKPEDLHDVASFILEGLVD